MLVAGPLLACEARSLVPDAGDGRRGGRRGRRRRRWDGGSSSNPPSPSELLSDFEDLAGATVVMAGIPPRNGYWYTYNDAPQGRPTCIQVPPRAAGAPDRPPPTSARPRRPPRQTMGQLRPARWPFTAKWSGCSDLGRRHRRRYQYAAGARRERLHRAQVPYDLSTYSGITFLAMAAPGTDTRSAPQAADARDDPDPGRRHLRRIRPPTSAAMTGASRST